MARLISFFFFPIFIFGCLYIPQTPVQFKSDEKILHRSERTHVCFEYKSERIDGISIEEFKKLNGDVYVGQYFKIKKSLETNFVNRIGISTCDGTTLYEFKIIISIDINFKMDCSVEADSTKWNGCQFWGFLSGLTLTMIPFWGISTSEVKYEVIGLDNRKYFYIYKPSIFSFFQIILIPISWINLFNGGREVSFAKSVDLFLIDSGLTTLQNK
ncbi:hypothetical protein [Leptospira weilii]|nr:hypothetical protein [Leptospira weilii]